MKNKYQCVHCDKVTDRESDKKWIKSYCEETGKNTRLQLIGKHVETGLILNEFYLLLCSVVVDKLKGWQVNDSQFDAMWYGYESLADQVSETNNFYPTEKELKKAMQLLKKQGKVMTLPLYDGDYMLCGKGWFLSNMYYDA